MARLAESRGPSGSYACSRRRCPRAPERWTGRSSAAAGVKSRYACRLYFGGVMSRGRERFKRRAFLVMAGGIGSLRGDSQLGRPGRKRPLERVLSHDVWRQRSFSGVFRHALRCLHEIGVCS